jgi:hypothetical protein
MSCCVQPGGEKAARQRSKKAATSTSRLSSGMAAALHGVQEAAERDLLRSLTGRAEQVLEDSRQKEDWLPTGPPGKSSSSWINALLSYLQVRRLCWVDFGINSY